MSRCLLDLPKLLSVAQKALVRPPIGNRRTISTTAYCLAGGDMKWTTNVMDKNDLPEDEKKKIEEDVKKQLSNWVPYGFHRLDKEADYGMWNFAMFWFLSFGIVTSAFTLIYRPDPSFRQWSMREAFLELERREKLGLPLVDPDLVPVDRIVLPDEEEITEFKIVI